MQSNNNVMLDPTPILDVWASNLKESIETIKHIKSEGYCELISFDTEFPGLSIKPHKQNVNSLQEYQTVFDNVNQQKMIQLGLTITNKQGYFSSKGCCFQFNFKYDLKKEQYDRDAILLLRNSGIDFEKLQEQGIDIINFIELMLDLDIFFKPEIKWICFHGEYDFAYLIKMMINDNLPDSIELFENYLSMYFPSIYDVKNMIQNDESIRNLGLSKLGFQLEIERQGNQHQAGSDSLLTIQCFLKIVNMQGQEAADKVEGVIYGVGCGFVSYFDYSFNFQQNVMDYHLMNDGYVQQVELGNAGVQSFQSFQPGFQQSFQHNLQQFQEEMQNQYTQKLKLKKKMKK